MSPEDLGAILEGLPRTTDDPDVLVGYESADDAGVYRLDDERAIVFTVDVITPLVDDPRDFGRIAAANSISDVYAMGGRPLIALNVSGFAPKLPPRIYRELLSGAHEIAREAGVAVLGGHTIKDPEIKYGMAVVGEIHPQRILTNRGARPGDALILTKALGTSALATAFKNRAFDDEDPRYRSMVASMTRLNREASELALRHGSHAMTDVTGFGLSGHGLEMAEGSRVTLTLELEQIPVLEGALEMLQAGYTCGGSQANRRRAQGKVKYSAGLDEFEEYLLHDPQTSGGLLVSLPEAGADAMLRTLLDQGHEAARIGRVEAKKGHFMEILG
jgi:selenide,water dikinase